MMGTLESKLNAPGVLIFRVKGDVTGKDIERWRDELVRFVSTHVEKGACGMLIDTCDVDSLSIDALDALLEILADPAEIIRDIKMRFALIGVKPFTQRFLREAMPLEEVKHLRARFFHEVSEGEALAWLQAMVASSDGASSLKPAKEEARPAKIDTKQAVTKTDQPKEAAHKEKVRERSIEKGGSAKAALAALKQSAKSNARKTRDQTP